MKNLIRVFKTCVSVYSVRVLNVSGAICDVRSNPYVECNARNCIDNQKKLFRPVRERIHH